MVPGVFTSKPLDRVSYQHERHGKLIDVNKLGEQVRVHMLRVHAEVKVVSTAATAFPASAHPEQKSVVAGVGKGLLD